MKKDKKKPRSQTITIELNNPEETDHIGIVADNREIKIFGNGGQEMVVEGCKFLRKYSGDSKERVVCELFGLTSTPSSIESGLTQFDKIYAVDTNTREVSGHILSVAVVAEVMIIMNQNGNYDYTIKFVESYLLQNVPGCVVERNSWAIVISRIAINKTVGEKIAIIVDSDLDNIKSYNSREKEIIEGFKLPDNITLQYATSNVKDTVANKAIDYCDKEANRRLKKIEKEILSGEFVLSLGNKEGT